MLIFKLRDGALGRLASKSEKGSGGTSKYCKSGQVFFHRSMQRKASVLRIRKIRSMCAEGELSPFPRPNHTSKCTTPPSTGPV